MVIFLFFDQINILIYDYLQNKKAFAAFLSHLIAHVKKES